MELWIVAGILSALIITFSNFVDQYVGRQFFPAHPVNQTLTNGAVYFIFLIPFGLFYPDVFDGAFHIIMLTTLCGLLLLAGVLPYFMALQKKNADQAVPLVQTMPIFIAFFAWVMLGETLTALELVSGFIIVFGAMGMLFDFHNRSFAFSVAGLMLLSTLIHAFDNTLIRLFATTMTWQFVTFWVLFGMCLGSWIMLLVFPSRRRFIMNVIKKSDGHVLLWNTVLQFTDVLAILFFVMAMSLAPSAAHVAFVAGTQPLFLLVVGWLLARVLPAYFRAETPDSHIVYQFAFAGLILVGLYLLTKS